MSKIWSLSLRSLILNSPVNRRAEQSESQFRVLRALIALGSRCCGDTQEVVAYGGWGQENQMEDLLGRGVCTSHI